MRGRSEGGEVVPLRTLISVLHTLLGERSVSAHPRRFTDSAPAAAAAAFTASLTRRCTSWTISRPRPDAPYFSQCFPVGCGLSVTIVYGSAGMTGGSPCLEKTCVSAPTTASYSERRAATRPASTGVGGRLPSPSSSLPAPDVSSPPPKRQSPLVSFERWSSYVTTHWRCRAISRQSSRWTLAPLIASSQPTRASGWVALQPAPHSTSAAPIASADCQACAASGRSVAQRRSAAPSDPSFGAARASAASSSSSAGASFRPRSCFVSGGSGPPVRSHRERPSAF